MNTQTATQPRKKRINTRLLYIDSVHNSFSHHSFQDISTLLTPNDILVVNNAATLPASLKGHHQESGKPIELRLATATNLDMTNISKWDGFIFGHGDWQLPTEKRTRIPHIKIGDRLNFSCGLSAIIKEILGNQRFVRIQFSGDNIWPKLYCAGRLIQYSYLESDLDLWDGQTILASCPVSVEPPSATFPLNWKTLLSLKEKGISILSLTHAAGISSTGDDALDRLLPLPERYYIPEKTASAINSADHQSRVIALGTSVTRALESAARYTGYIAAGAGIGTLKIAPGYTHKVVDGLITGMHEPGSSHLELLQSFAPLDLIRNAYGDAAANHYLWHEYGDSCLILAQRTRGL